MQKCIFNCRLISVIHYIAHMIMYVRWRPTEIYFATVPSLTRTSFSPVMLYYKSVHRYDPGSELLRDPVVEPAAESLSPRRLSRVDLLDVQSARSFMARLPGGTALWWRCLLVLARVLGALWDVRRLNHACGLSLPLSASYGICWHWVESPSHGGTIPKPNKASVSRPSLSRLW